MLRRRKEGKYSFNKRKRRESEESAAGGWTVGDGRGSGGGVRPYLKPRNNLKLLGEDSLPLMMSS